MNLQEISIQAFHSGSKHETFLLETAGRFFEIGKDTAELLTYLQQQGGDDESIENYVKAHGGIPSKEEIISFMETMNNKTTPVSSDEERRKTFLYNKDFISSDAIGRCSSVLRCLFHPWVMLVVIPLFTTLEIIYFTHYSHPESYHSVNIYNLVGMYSFLILSSLIHELGHASACRYYGASHGNIGVGLYLNFPVFYTDVSYVWKLKRLQRCVVNFAGVYFQMILLTPFLLLAIIDGNNLLKYVILLTNLNFVITMNPFFRFDGYWMVTDILGVANLRKKGREWIVYVGKTLIGKRPESHPHLFTLTRWALYGLVTYTVVVSMFFGFYLFYCMPMFFVRFYETFPSRFKQMLTELSYHQMPEWSNLQQMVLQLFFLFLFLYMIYRFVSHLLKRIQWKN